MTSEQIRRLAKLKRRGCDRTDRHDYDLAEKGFVEIHPICEETTLLEPGIKLLDRIMTHGLSVIR